MSDDEFTRNCQNMNSDDYQMMKMISQTIFNVSQRIKINYIFTTEDNCIMDKKNLKDLLR